MRRSTGARDHGVRQVRPHVQHDAVAAYLEAGVHPAEPFARDVGKVGADVAVLDVELVRAGHHVVLFRDGAVKVNKRACDHVQPAVRQPLRIVDLDRPEVNQRPASRRVRTAACENTRLTGRAARRTAP